MAEKIIKLKLQVDVEEGKKLVSIVKEQENGLNSLQSSYARISQLNSEILAQKEREKQAFTELKTKVENYNSILKQGGSAANLVYNQAQSSLAKYNKTLQDTIQETQRLASARNLLTLGVAPSNRIPQPATPTVVGGFTRSAITGKLIPAAPSASSAIPNISPKLTEEINKNTDSLNKNSIAIDTNRTKHRSLITHIAEAVSIYRVYNSILNLTQQALLNIPKAGIQAQASQAAIFGIFGSEKGRENLQFIKDLGNSAGQVVSDLEQSYAKFAPSAALAGANQEQINQIFKDFTEVSTVLTLSKDKVDSVFLALDQIFSKGVVQSEEIKKQLGNALPGAVEIGAKAFGKSPAAFLEAMKNNEVIAKDFVPKFARLYREIFGGVDDSVFKLNSTKLLSNLNRLQNAYTDINRKSFEDTQGVLNSTVKLAAEAIEGLNRNLEGTKQILEAIGSLIAVRLGVAAVTNINKLAVALVGLRTPQLAVLAGFTALILELAGLDTKYDEHRGFVTKVRGEYVNTADLIENVVIVTFERLFALLKTIDDFDLSNLYNPFKAFDALRDTPRDLLGDFEKEYKKNLQSFTSGSGNSVTDTINEAKEKYLDSFTSVLEIQEAIRTKALKNSEDIAQAFLRLENYSPAPEAPPIQDDEAEKVDKLQKQKETAFNKEKKYRDEIQKQIDLQYQREKDILGLKKNLFDIEVERRSVSSSPVTKREIIENQFKFSSGEAILQQNSLNKSLEVSTNYGNRLKTVFEETNKAINTSTNNVEKKLAAIEKIESGGKIDAVSKTGALGQFQVQPSTFANPGYGLSNNKVPQEILNAELSSKLGTRTQKQFEILQKYAVDNVDKLTPFGKQYFLAVQDHFKLTDSQAAAAYNAGAKPVLNGKLPAETVKYVEKFNSELSPGDTLQEENVNNQLQIKNTLFQIGNQQQINLAERNKNLELLANEVKLEESKLKIEELNTLGKTKEAALAEIKLEFKERIRNAEALESDFLLKRLPILQKEKEYAVDIAEIKEKYNQNEEKYQRDLQEVTNKVQIGILTQQQGVAQTITIQKEQSSVQDTLLNQWIEFSKLSGNVKDNVEAVAAQQERISRGQQAASSLNVSNFPGKASLDSEISSLGALKNVALDGEASKYERDKNKSLTALEDRKKAEAEIINNYNQKAFIANTTYYEGIASIAANSTLSVVKSFQKMYGEQSKQAKAAFILYKAFAIAEAIMGTARGVVQALTIPYVGIALAAVIAAAGAIQIATIVNQPLPSAHAGLTNVPEDATYALKGGERVLSTENNKDFTDDLRQRRNKRNEENKVVNNIRVINVTDESMVYSALGSSQGEEIILNVVRRNRNA